MKSYRCHYERFHREKWGSEYFRVRKHDEDPLEPDFVANPKGFVFGNREWINGLYSK